jgi:HK97 family phage prohead protease
MSVALKDRRLESLSQRLAAKVLKGAEPGSIKGTAIRYGVDVPRGYGLFLNVEKGAFVDQVADPSRVKVLWQHDEDTPIGRINDLRDISDRMDFGGRISTSEKVPQAETALELLRDEILDEVSVGFDILKFDRQIDEENDRVTYIVKKARLREISVVTFGALGEDAVVKQVASESGSVAVDQVQPAPPLRPANTRGRFRGGPVGVRCVRRALGMDCAGDFPSPGTP